MFSKSRKINLLIAATFLFSQVAKADYNVTSQCSLAYQQKTDAIVENTKSLENHATFKRLASRKDKLIGGFAISGMVLAIVGLIKLDTKENRENNGGVGLGFRNNGSIFYTLFGVPVTALLGVGVGAGIGAGVNKLINSLRSDKLKAEEKSMLTTLANYGELVSALRAANELVQSAKIIVAQENSRTAAYRVGNFIKKYELDMTVVQVSEATMQLDATQELCPNNEPLTEQQIAEKLGYVPVAAAL